MKAILNFLRSLYITERIDQREDIRVINEKQYNYDISHSRQKYR